MKVASVRSVEELHPPQCHQRLPSPSVFDFGVAGVQRIGKAASQADVGVEFCRKFRDASGVDLCETVVALAHALVATVCRWRLDTLAQTGSSKNGCGHCGMALA